jgi:putative selenate reductase
VLELFGAKPPALTDAGYIAVDPFTLESSIPGVYAAGDVADDGPSSIVKAAADGKAAAAAIIAAHGVPVAEPEPEAEPVDVAAMIVRRARREYRFPVKTLALEERDGSRETVLGYSAERPWPRRAAASTATHLQPVRQRLSNLALMTYRSEPLRAALPALRLEAGGIREGERHAYRADQALQIAVLTDLCNECGNCTTVCPTSGQPWRDKPRLYLDAADFESQADNAFRLLADGSIEARWAGETHRLSMNGVVEYTSPAVTAGSIRDLQLLNPARPRSMEDTLTLDRAADMLVLVRPGRSIHTAGATAAVGTGAAIGDAQ